MVKIDDENYLTLKEAGEMIKKNPETIRRWIKKRKIEGRKVGLYYYVKEIDLKKLFENKY